ncbi:hypothetical protein JM84_2438 [Dokdonia sp. Hel_I_63]|uniref:hypothetical protein n=1 Tax=Dokdonia sp. Hel_I_63 TaxID=1249996 RepID=UPI001199DED8|nr:hypothetical protein [Dokdonia sp. Hel_I_63]TVZ23510.1 hypothetical protein JM84_2438 [Dokdonia sp. Hel_I_63]
MKTYQNLEIHLDYSENLNFIKDLKNLIEKSEWKIRQDFVDNYKKNTFSKEKEILCVETTEYKYGNKEIKGAVWLWDYNGFLEVFNIIPLIRNSLDFDQYNFLLNEFYTLFIKDLGEKFNAKIVVSEPVKKLINTIGEEAYSALESFSIGANKTTGNTHPFDFKRWCEFIFIIFRNDIEIGVDELIFWLEENGWDSDMANRLGLEFEYSLNLLKNYERN